MSWERRNGGWLACSLRRKIGLAFGAVLVLHTAIALLSHFGLDFAIDGMTRYDAGRKLAVDMVEVDRKVGELQRYVLSFTHTGHRSAPQRVEQIRNSIVDDLRRAHARAEEPVARAEIESMLGAIESYYEYFQLAIADRRERKRLVEDEIPQLAARARAAFERIAESGEVDGSAGVAAARVRNQYLEAEAAIRTYLHELDFAAIRRSAADLERCRRELDAIEGEVAPNVVAAARSAVDSTERLSTRLVQSTRGYMHLVHVVMAGQSAEFLRASARTRQAHLERLDALSASILSSQKRFQLLSALISIATIILGIVASSLLRRVLVTPLRRITETLSQLARGQHEVEIPGRERADEIGAMAEAAQVFAERNRETADMLDRLQKLAVRHESTIADLESSNAELDNFVHIASHDLKAPLRGIAVLAECIREDSAGVLPAEGYEHLSKLENRVERMGRLLGNLLAFAKAGRSELCTEQVVIRECIHDAILMADVPSSFNIAVTGDAEPFEAARVALVQVVQNLVANAVRHHDRDSGSIEIAVLDGEDMVEVAVSDDGPGIPPEFHERVFRPFESLQRRDEDDSSGVGLALVQRLVDRCGGLITLESFGSRGTTMRVRWPRHGAAHLAAASPLSKELAHA